MFGIVRSLKSWTARKIWAWAERKRVTEVSTVAAELQAQIRNQLEQHYEQRLSGAINRAEDLLHAAYADQTSRLTTLLAQKELEIYELKTGKSPTESSQAPCKSAKRSRSKRVSRA
jgi:hypothetical protein